MTTAEPTWLKIARQLIGISETKGPEHTPEILQFWRDIKRGGIRDDETPWCAAFVGAVLERAGIRSSRFESAKSYLQWGLPLDRPIPGCVVVFGRSGGGHVGFVIGKTAGDGLLVLGGNQGDAVNIRAFPRSRVLGYRWPAGVQIASADLPTGSATASTSEA